MDADDSKYWRLFENRPAKERTSPPAAEEGRGRPVKREGGSRAQRAPRATIGREHVKC
jgi:hypothetical protein